MASLTDSAVAAALKQHFGYASFRPGQQDIVRAILAGADCLVIMPTGSGKSLLYQLPAVLWPGTTVVVSPLIALMENQIAFLQRRNVPAGCLNSSQRKKEKDEVMRKLATRQLKLLYITPEFIASPAGSSLLDQLYAEQSLSAFAVDEAHCISDWGHDFRPKYRVLSTLTDRYSKLPIIAVSATATPDVRRDILSCLKLRNPRVVVSSFNRPEISYEVVPKTDPENFFLQVRDFMHQNFDLASESGIVYCQTRAECEGLAACIGPKSAVPYHSGMTATERRSAVDAWMQNHKRIVCATIAFGMGIDRPDCRFVVHATMSKSVEAFYQESGRAARDGAPSRSVIFYHPHDMRKLLFLSQQELEEARRQCEAGTRDPKTLEMQCERRQKALASMEEFLVSPSCRRRFLLRFFGDRSNDKNLQKGGGSGGQPERLFSGEFCCDVCRCPDKNRSSLTAATATRRRPRAVVLGAGDDYDCDDIQGNSYDCNDDRVNAEAVRNRARTRSSDGDGSSGSGGGGTLEVDDDGALEQVVQHSKKRGRDLDGLLDDLVRYEQQQEEAEEKEKERRKCHSDAGASVLERIRSKFGTSATSHRTSLAGAVGGGFSAASALLETRRGIVSSRAHQPQQSVSVDLTRARAVPRVQKQQQQQQQETRQKEPEQTRPSRTIMDFFQPRDASKKKP